MRHGSMIRMVAGEPSVETRHQTRWAAAPRFTRCADGVKPQRSALQ